MADEPQKPPLLRTAPRPVPPRIAPPPVMPQSQRVQPIIARLARPAPVMNVAAPPPRGNSLLTLAELDRFKNLLVFARSTVEGYFTGKHRSPYRGSSVEFADYKDYVPGDELNRIDWRAYGRTRRLFVRQYEAETDMVIYLLVDVSASMNYAGQQRQSKYILAAKVAAALSYLMIHQGDKAALGLFGETLNQFHPPGGTRRHLHSLITSLERVKPADGTGLAQALHEAGPLFKKRGRLVILSDFWTDPDALFDALGQFLHRRFEILLLHVMDPDELNLPAANTARFRDMETQEEIEVEPEEIRRAYRQTVDERIQLISGEANNRRVSHSLVNTQHPYLDAIEAYLGFRGRTNLQTG
jgi:uncharacterized protein (DUF58 family)